VVVIVVVAVAVVVLIAILNSRDVFEAGLEASA